MRDALKRSFILFIVFAVAFLSVHAFRAWQEGRPIFQFGKVESPGQFATEHATLAETSAVEPGEVVGLERQNQEMTRLVAKVRPAVVSIHADIQHTETLRDPFTKRVYKRSLLRPGLGSGVIVSREGHVVTNYHVIESYKRIRVTLHDGRSLPARLVGKDELLDVAVLALKGNEGEQFTPLKFADSDQVQVGQLAIAIGNPYGLGETVTMGHISARDRSNSDKERDMFQTDAAINPGNSGGPLINHLGEIIAINRSIFTKDPENPRFQGIGFSIPANDVKRSFLQICEKGRPVYGYLGLIQVGPVNNYLRSVFGYEGDGAMIHDVIPGSPADRAGLKPNDIVMAFDGEGVSTPDEFLTRLRRSPVGSQCALSVWRGNEFLKLEATIEEIDPFWAPSKAQGKRLASDQAIKRQIGLVVRTLPRFYQARGMRGVVVTRVLPESMAHTRGIRPNDLILSVNGSAVNNAADFEYRLVASAAVQQTRLEVRRGDRTTQVLLSEVPRTD